MADSTLHPFAYTASGGTMLATFAEWPIVAVAGVVVQAIALWVMAARWAPRVGVDLRRWAGNQRARPDSGRPAGSAMSVGAMVADELFIDIHPSVNPVLLQGPR